MLGVGGAVTFGRCATVEGVARRSARASLTGVPGSNLTASID